MESWVLWSFLAASLWAATNIFDKVVLSKYIESSLQYLVIVGFVAAIPVPFLWMFFDIQSISNLHLVILLGISIIQYFSWYLYFRAIEISDATTIGALWQMIPVMTLIIGAIFLHEHLTRLQYIGVLAVVVGAMIVSIDHDVHLNRKKLSKSFFLMLAAVFIWSVQNSIFDYFLQSTTTTTIFFYQRLGAVIGALTLLCLPQCRKALPSRKQIFSWVGVGILVEESFSIMGIYAIIMALSLGSLTLVNTAAATQPLIALIMITILNKCYKNLVPGTGWHGHAHYKLPAVLAIIVGVYLIV